MRLLPSVFIGDGHTLDQGITEALLPEALQLFHPQQQEQQWSPTDWPQFAETSRMGWGSHWQSLWSASFRRGVSPVLSDTCRPDCTIHSEAVHAATVLLNKFTAWPGQYVQLWQPGRTDEVLFWLTQQISPEASSPPSPSSSFADLPFQPTRQDAGLLRICEECCFFSFFFFGRPLVRN